MLPSCISTSEVDEITLVAWEPGDSLYAGEDWNVMLMEVGEGGVDTRFSCEQLETCLLDNVRDIVCMCTARVPVLLFRLLRLAGARDSSSAAPTTLSSTLVGQMQLQSSHFTVRNTGTVSAAGTPQGMQHPSPT